MREESMRKITYILAIIDLILALILLLKELI
nr:MAG TPA: hypothetical protein [Caudoviricetes sp.]